MTGNLFNRVVNYFIHPRLKVDQSTYEKSKISVGALLVIFLITILYVAFYFSISGGINGDLKSILNYVDVLALTAAIFLIKWKGWVQAALSIMAYIYLILFSASIYVSGGINSYDISWLIVLSAASYLLIGIRTGFSISVLSFFIITIFYFLENNRSLQGSTSAAQLTLSYKYFNLTLVLALLSLLVYFLVRGNKKLEEIIHKSKEQKIKEEIAKDFHEQIGNKLASIRHMAELIRLKQGSEEQKMIVDGVSLKAKEVYDNFRDFIWTLDAKSDRADELFMYLRDFAEDYYKFSSINLFITSYPDQVPSILLPSYYSKEIIPIFKEAIINVYKHAKAQNVYLNYSVTPRMVSIKLKDDGKGIQETSLSLGKGLEAMRNHARLTGGSLVFITSPNKGTEIVYEVLLPMKK